MSDKIRLFELTNNELADDREFMAFYLEKFQEIENISQQDLCSQLNCSSEEYYKLALCKAPEADSTEFISRLNNIGQYTGVSVFGLSSMIKRVNSILTLSGQSHKNYLMAARDKTKKEDDDTKGDVNGNC